MKKVTVTRDRWRAGIKFLCGCEDDLGLSDQDQSKLKEALRGPFARGMREADAARFLRDGLGWEVPW